MIINHLCYFLIPNLICDRLLSQKSSKTEIEESLKYHCHIIVFQWVKKATSPMIHCPGIKVLEEMQAAESLKSWEPKHSISCTKRSNENINQCHRKCISKSENHIIRKTSTQKHQQRIHEKFYKYNIPLLTRQPPKSMPTKKLNLVVHQPKS